MNHPVRAIALIVLLFISGISNVEAQVNVSKWQIGINGGMLVYQGDLAPPMLGLTKHQNQ